MLCVLLRQRSSEKPVGLRVRPADLHVLVQERCQGMSDLESEGAAPSSKAAAVSGVPPSRDGHQVWPSTFYSQETAGADSCISQSFLCDTGVELQILGAEVKANIGPQNKLSAFLKVHREGFRGISWYNSHHNYNFISACGGKKKKQVVVLNLV